jgi:hypothetical protein
MFMDRVGDEIAGYRIDAAIAAERRRTSDALLSPRRCRRMRYLQPAERIRGATGNTTDMENSSEGRRARSQRFGR